MKNRDTREVVREEMARRDQIRAFLAAGPRTVPEIAAHLDRPAWEVMYWVMGMRRYGLVGETGVITDEGYYRYAGREGN